jgi:hypothetical protein
MEIKERIDLYRQSLTEWERRRRAALEHADECLGKMHACRGAIEALESLLPATPIEDVIEAAENGTELRVAPDR